MRTQLSEKYINGYDIEIGALHNPLFVKNGKETVMNQTELICILEKI